MSTDVFLSDLQHPDWADYIATNLLDALEQVPDTGDWYGAVKAWCERNKTGKLQPNRTASASGLPMHELGVDGDGTPHVLFGRGPDEHRPDVSCGCNPDWFQDDDLGFWSHHAFAKPDYQPKPWCKR